MFRVLTTLGFVMLIGLVSPATGATTFSAFDRVCATSRVGHFDQTAAAANGFPLDVPSGTTMFAGIAATYFGSTATFGGVRVDVGKAGVGGHLAWAFWNGQTWIDLGVSNADLDASGW